MITIGIIPISLYRVKIKYANAPYIVQLYSIITSVIGNCLGIKYKCTLYVLLLYYYIVAISVHQPV